MAHSQKEPLSVIGVRHVLRWREGSDTRVLPQLLDRDVVSISADDDFALIRHE